MTLQEEYRQMMSRVMSRVNLGTSREVLTILVNQLQPQGMTREEADWWREEKQKCLDDWDRELESSGTLNCSGGSLIQTPVSSAVPEKLPGESFTQLPLL